MLPKNSPSDLINIDEPLVKLPDIDALTGVSRYTRWRWLKTGYLPRPDLYLNGSPRWYRATIADFLARQAANPTPPEAPASAGKLSTKGNLRCCSKKSRG